MINIEDDEEGETGSSASHFVRIPLRGAHAQESAILALRIIAALDLYGRLLDSDGDIEDCDVLSLVGLDERKGRKRPLSTQVVKTAFKHQLEHLEQRFQRKDDALAGNIEKLCNIMRLSQRERFALRLCVIATLKPRFRDLFNRCHICKAALDVALNRIAGRRMSGPTRVFGQRSRLRRAGLLVTGDDDFDSCPLKMDFGLAERMTSNKFDIDSLVRNLVRPAAVSKLSMADFSHVADIGLLTRYAHDASKHRRRGANVLIYGTPGTGKSEFVRAFAQASRCRLFEVPNEDSEGDPISGPARFRAYALCQQLMVDGSGQMLLFDEVEDVFGSNDDGFFASFFGRHRNADSLRKSWVNETLESNPVPTFWVCNSIRAMDPAYLRRFDIIMEFRTPGRSVRRRLVDRYFREGEISPTFAERLASDGRIAPAHLERVSRVMRTLHARTSRQREAEVERLLTSSLRAAGVGKALALPEIPAHYDLEFLNASADLSALAASLGSGSNARICLYGPPGTGKTAFAHYLGRHLDRPVLVRRASDLLSMWVGRTEQLIAEAFARAKDENAILVIDEADSFLRDRTGAQQGWEVTQVNELLTQMEAFDGIFLASTNLVDTLDAASLRRFDFKLKFDYLTREQRRRFLARVAGNADLDLDGLGRRLDRLETLTPGDFANVLRQFAVRGTQITARESIELLERETAIKPEGRKRTIGFV